MNYLHLCVLFYFMLQHFPVGICEHFTRDRHQRCADLRVFRPFIQRFLVNFKLDYYHL